MRNGCPTVTCTNILAPPQICAIGPHHIAFAGSLIRLEFAIADVEQEARFVMLRMFALHALAR